MVKTVDAVLKSNTHTHPRRLLMAKLILALVMLLLFSTSALAIDFDKKLHAGISFPIGILGGAVLESCCSEWPWYYKLPAATAIGLIPGVFKEAIDVGGSGWSWGDILADTAGAASGAGCVLLIRW